MNRLRAFLLRHRAMALIVIALALAMKALVPAGYMIGSDTRVLTIRICDGGAAPVAATVPIAGHARPGHGDGAGSMPDHQACPYSALAHGALGGADPIQIALALAFIVVAGLAMQPGLVRRTPARLRPPLRAPPVFG